MHPRLLPIALALFLCLAMPAFASNIPPSDIWDPTNPNDELNFYEIYNALYGTSYTSSAQLNPLYVPGLEVFNVAGGSATVDARARYAGSQQIFGYYQPTGTTTPTLTQLFHVTQQGLLTMDAEVIFPVGDFGFYLDPVGARANPNFWFSESALNEDGGRHMFVYRTPNPNTYLLAWADLYFNGTADHDYNDLVVELTIHPFVIPEPSSLLLLGAGVSAFGWIRRRRSLARA